MTLKEVLRDFSSFKNCQISKLITAHFDSGMAFAECLTL